MAHQVEELSERPRSRIIALAALLVMALVLGRGAISLVAARALFELGQWREGALLPRFDGPDADRPRLSVRLVAVARGLHGLTELREIPGRPDAILAVQKSGVVSVLDLTTGEATPWFSIDVGTELLQGLLSVALHPEFASNGRFFLYYTPPGPNRVALAEWRASLPDPFGAAPTPASTLLEVEHTSKYHYGGQIAFGPDGRLYLGVGDGWDAGDPHREGQDRGVLHGKILRLDVDAGRPYAVPPDNPYVGVEGARPEIWALGVRNPWRMSFTPAGALVVGDVGENSWEEIDLIAAGANLGWSTREGPACFRAGAECDAAGFTEPVYTYGREDGASVIGGYVVTGDRVPALQGLYVFADFETGRLWALPLPSTPGAGAGAARTLGRFDLSPSTFGLDGRGDVLVGDFGRGVVYRIEPAEAGQTGR